MKKVRFNDNVDIKYLDMKSHINEIKNPTNFILNEKKLKSKKSNKGLGCIIVDNVINLFSYIFSNKILLTILLVTLLLLLITVVFFFWKYC